MPQDIFDNAFRQGQITKTKLKNKYGRDFANHTDYFDKLDVNNIKFEDMATDLHVMTKTENGDFISEPLNVALSRIKATNSTAPCTKPDGVGLTEAEYAMKAFWFSSFKFGKGLHVFVNTEKDITKPKKLEPKYIDMTNRVSSLVTTPANANELERLIFTEGSLEDSNRRLLDDAKSAGRHCDSKGWLNFKKFFSSKATKEKLQNEYDNYQALKVSVAENETKMKAAAQSTCELYTDPSPDKIATIEKETFEANKREVVKYKENEIAAKIQLEANKKAAKMQLEANDKAANMQLAAKVINKCADKLPDFEKMYMHYVNALMSNEGFKKHTLGYTNTILGNENEEARLIKYVTQNRKDKNPSRLSETIAAAKDNFEKNGDIKLDIPEPEIAIPVKENAIPEKENAIPVNAPEIVIEDVANDVQPQFSEKALQYLYILANSEYMTSPHKVGHVPQLEFVIQNSPVFEKYFGNVPDEKMSSVFYNKEFKNEMGSYENLTALNMVFDEVYNVPVADLKSNDIKKKLRETTQKVAQVANEVKDSQSADFVANTIMNVLKINGNNISPEEKCEARKAISSNEIVKSFVVGKTVAEIKSMQTDPKKKQEFQAVINTVIKSYVAENIKKEPEHIAPENIKKEPEHIAPENIKNEPEHIAPPKDKENDNKPTAVATKKKPKGKILW